MSGRLVGEDGKVEAWDVLEILDVGANGNYLLGVEEGSAVVGGATQRGLAVDVGKGASSDDGGGGVLVGSTIPETFDAS